MQHNVQIDTVIHILADMIYDYMLKEERESLDQYVPSQEGDLSEPES